MRKIIAFLLIATILISCDSRRKDKIADDNVTQSEKALKQTTSVQIIDSSYNFGKVTDGEMVEYSYRFKNIGTNPLVVIEAHASCGCTIPQKPEKPIMPGQIGFIKVQFDSKGRAGNAYKTITVSSNAKPEFPQLVLTGDVVSKQ